MQSIETSTQLFSQATTLMIVGMVFVFAFLALMIVVIKFMITPLAKKFPDVEVKSKRTMKTAATQDSAIIAAISAAVNKYRKTHK